MVVRLFAFLILLLLPLFLFLGQTNAQNVRALAHIPVCTVGNPELPRCHARVVVDDKGKPHATTSPTGLGPAQLLAAYGVSGTVSATRTIAIVDAYNHPTIANDLTTFSTTYGLPLLSSCAVATGTSAAPCFQKVDQRGGTAYPATDSGWALEIALDVEAAHSMCQNCNILLVEADSSSYTNLMAAVDQAVAMGATVVSNSYGSSEFSGETTYDSHFNRPGIPMTFSAGDSGYGSSYPAASRYVVSVGGTTLSMNGTTYLGESVWNGTGSGCSKYETKPSWQHDTGCLRRMIGDVSADADPSSGLSVYDSTPYSGQTGWWQVGGTSLSSPIIASIYALAGDANGVTSPASLSYARVSYGTTMHDVTSGNNGRCFAKPSYFCRATSGYDGPTGLGTPKGFAAF